NSVVTNTATIAAAETDPSTVNNTASVVATVGRVADVSITKTVSSSTVTAGSSLTYRLTVTNNGPSAASSVVVTDPLPAGVIVTSAPGCTGTTTLTCAMGDLSVSAVATMAVTVLVGPSLGDGAALTNTATVIAAETDPSTVNNTASAVTTVGRVADVS